MRQRQLISSLLTACPLTPMRVISGSAKGLRLSAPNTNKVRPAADKVKGAIFNILGDISGLKVLDLFAGSGSVGIEALSRGAGECVFVEGDRKIASFIQKNLDHCDFERVGEILRIQVAPGLSYLKRKKRQFDLIFVDPPYDQGLVEKTLRLLENSPLLSEMAQIIVEHSPREIPSDEEGLEIFDQRRYGQTLVTFLKQRL